MSVENTDLERRVLAHEQILQHLMAQLADGNPRFLDRMMNRFASARRGAYEHDHVETADYAAAFLIEVSRMVRVPKFASSPISPVVPQRRHSPPAPKPVFIAVTRAGNVWHVTRDGKFVGDYLTEKPARSAAELELKRAAELGICAELILPTAASKPLVGSSARPRWT